MRPAEAGATGDGTGLHVSKLRGIDLETRAKLKRQRITYADQLLAAAGGAAGRRQLTQRVGIDEAVLWRLVRRADLARVKGIGAIFADMLESAGVDRVEVLAGEEPARLHARLVELNAAERFARRAPTADEVADWVRQARSLPIRLEPPG